MVYPPVEDIAEAIARHDNVQVIPTGATAQNNLGLSTQVPMNAVFLTSGSALKIKMGGRTIPFCPVTPFTRLKPKPDNNPDNSYLNSYLPSIAVYKHCMLMEYSSLALS